MSDKKLFLVEEDERVIVTRRYYVRASSLDEATHAVNEGSFEPHSRTEYEGDDDLNYDDSREIGEDELPEGASIQEVD